MIVIAVDFDGTIAEHEFPEIGKPVPGAFRWMKAWRKAGAKLVLFTMRSDGRTGEGKANGPVLSEAVEFCREHGVEFWGVNRNPEQDEWTTSPKAYAQVYVDDAAFGCPLIPAKVKGGRPMVDWKVVGPAILKRIKQ